MQKTGSTASRVHQALHNQWVPPEYTSSVSVELDYQLAEKSHCIIDERPCIELDRIKMLRTHVLNRTRLNNWRTIMVTSVNPGEGKTVTAINLAFSVAREHQQTVALVDCDMRKPSIGRYLGLRNQPSIADYFMENKPLSEIMLWPGVEKMTIFAGDKSVPGSAEIIGSPRMEALVTEMKERYQDRYIFFDLPPMLAVPDAHAFMPYVDCVLLVVEAGKTPGKEIVKAQQLIPSDKLLGFVLNKDTVLNEDHYYGPAE